VEEPVVRSWLADLTRAGTKASAWDCTWLAEFGTLEAWLRLLLRYDAGREVAE